LGARAAEHVQAKAYAQAMPNDVTRLPSRSSPSCENWFTFFGGADSDKKRQIADRLTIAVIRVLMITLLDTLYAVVDEM
jgi:hypothetical protein